MVETLKKDTERWHTQVKNDRIAKQGRIVEEPDRLLAAYVGSEIHMSRQHHGPPAGGHPSHYLPNNLPPDMGDGGYVSRPQIGYGYPARYEPSPNYPGPGAHGTPPPPPGHQYPGGPPPMNPDYNGHPGAGSTPQARPPPQATYYPAEEFYPSQPMGRGEMRNGPPRNGGPPQSHYPVNPPIREQVYAQGSRYRGFQWQDLSVR